MVYGTHGKFAFKTNATKVQHVEVNT